MTYTTLSNSLLFDSHISCTFSGNPKYINKQKAAKWYIKAANQGLKDAANMLTNLALTGSKVAQEWIAAKEKVDQNLGQLKVNL